MSSPPPLPPRKPPDWWGRNWKWFVPVICLVAFTFIAGFLGAVMGFIKSSDAYTSAMDRLKSAPALVAAIGAPVKDGYFVTGNISTYGNFGVAELTIPLSGPNGGAWVSLHGSKRLGVWHFENMIVHVDATQGTIDLSEHFNGTQWRSSP
jgi:hypothetical protein